MTGRSTALDGLFSEARLVTCQDYALRAGWSLKRSGAYLTGPCPKCGGTDRFSIETNQDKWNCRGCGVGGTDCISMVVNCEPIKSTKYGPASVEACEIITGRRSSDAVDDATIAANIRKATERQAGQAAASERYRANARRKGFEIWRQGRPADEHVAAYLAGRGVAVDVMQFRSALREHLDLPFWHAPKAGEISTIVHRGVAMLAVMQWSDDRFGLVHMTWLDPAGDKGKAKIYSADQSELLDAKKMRGSKGDGAIRLVTPAAPARLIIGEGIETTLSPFCHAFDERTAYWCALDLGHMAGKAARNKAGAIVRHEPDMADERVFKAPSWADEVIYLADADGDKAKTAPTMQRAGARAKKLNPKLSVKVAWAEAGKDFGDMAMDEIEDQNDDTA